MMKTPLNKQGISSCMASELGFIRPIYKALFLRRRTYAAFEVGKIQDILARLAPDGPIFDPMSGYGVLSDICRSMRIPTISVELNPPSYLWQVLMTPQYDEMLLIAVDALRQTISTIRPGKDFEVSEFWFPEESERILNHLWEKALRRAESQLGTEQAEDALGAVILPFVGRFSSHSPGSINIHVKKGGVVVYEGWKNELKLYLKIIRNMIVGRSKDIQTEHEVVYGDAASIKLSGRRFSYMVTSPPYPNMKDYYAFFFPENYALEKIFSIKRFASTSVRTRIIGTSVVSDFKKTNSNDFNSLSSVSAKKFLSNLQEWKGTKRSVDDNQSYYLPYYLNYFLSLERAYKNINSLLNNKFKSYVIVVNNTARNLVIPVNLFIKDVWQNFGCSVTEDNELTSERSHVGSINPRAVGFKARHMEYVIRITREER